MITPRTTRLVRVPDLRAFRDVIVALAADGTPFDIRDRLVIVPTRSAAAHLLRAIEHRLPAERQAAVIPSFVTPGDLVARFAERLPGVPTLLTEAEREALLGVACRTARDAGHVPPFRLRPGLVAEILRFYDALRLNQKDVDTFERLALGALEGGAAADRGAERLVRQTRFLAASFRAFERLIAECGASDAHAVRAAVLAQPAGQPWRHAVLTVGDRARDPHGLLPALWDLLARVPGLERLDVVATEATIAGAFHERIHQLLPGIEEVSGAAIAGTDLARSEPLLLLPANGGTAHVARDREEEVAGFARWVKHLVRGGTGALPEMALVVRQPLPYVYVAREVLRAGGIPSQMFDALPLAGEPYAAALDLIFSCVSSNFARVPATALLRSPHFAFGDVTLKDVAALDRALSDAGYLGDAEALARALDGSTSRAGAELQRVVAELGALREPAAVAAHLDVLLAFLAAHDRLPGPDDPLRVRQLRARAAVGATLAGLRDAYRRFDAAPIEFDEVAAMVRRWIDAQTFAPRSGDGGVHVVDAASARYGDFACVQLAGLVDGEWPDRPARNIFYSSSILRDLGWTADAERVDGARAAFADLLRLPAARLRVSTFALEADAIVAPSNLIDDIDGAGLDALEEGDDPTPIFDYEALSSGAAPETEARFRGQTDGHVAGALSLSALERYQDCPFRFFAADVLKLDEAPEDEPALSPRARGRFVHEVFQRFFEAWDARGERTITPDRVDAARQLFEEIAAPLLAQLPDADAALERARLFGSAISIGMADVVLALEASRPETIVDRWLERRFEGEFTLAGERPVRLRGVADRIDLLSGNRLRVIDYKSGYAPEVRRALQVPIYALCARETLSSSSGGPWTIDEAAYVAFSGKRSLAAVIKPGADDVDETLAAARARLYAVLDGVAAGEFPPRPHEPRMCTSCPYPSVCRKDYVGDE